LAVVVGEGEFWKLNWEGVLSLVGAARITMDITFIASEWPEDTWININKIALMDHTVWNWVEVDRDMMVVTKISGANPPGDTGDGNVAWWGPWLGDATWTISWRLENIPKYNGTYEFYMALQCSKEKGDGGYFYIDNIKVVTEDLASPPPRLHADGNKIKNDEDKVVTLRGVSLIDLGFLQDWQGGAINMIDRLTDPTDASCNTIGWMTNVIRIPIVPPGWGWPYEFDPDNNDDLYNLLRSVVDYCGSKGIYAIIDWHDINNTFDTIDKALAFWDYMAPRFADDEHVMYELFNEPINDVGDDTDDWLSVKSDMDTLIALVRTHAPDTLLFIGTPFYCQILGPIVDNPVLDENVVYVTHLYPYHWIHGHAYYTSSIAAAAEAHPVILGEWGFIDDTADNVLKGTISNYGEPLRQFIEGLGIGSIAWVSSYDWQPPMYDNQFTLLDGEGYMGCFAKEWIYSGWESEQDLDIPLTISRCQVTADTTSRKDSLEIYGTFSRTPPNLLAVPHLDVTITSLSNSAIIYTENCDYVWDIAGNRFICSRFYTMDQPGRITLLLIDFSRRTFILRAQNIDLTGLGSPMQLDISVGAYLLSGEVDETVINGDELIPFRLMRDYQDQIRLTEVVLKKGLTKGTDILTVSGDIATDNPGINLTNQKVIINWGDQPFAIPARSFIQTKNRNRYTCKVDVPGGFVDCLIDFDQFRFTVNLSKASLNATSGRVKFMIRFAQFKQFEYVQM
jgi:hypothetical protein